MKRVLILFLCCSIFITLFKVTLNASSTYLEGYQEVTEKEERILNGNVILNNQRIKTLHNGSGDVWNNHTVNYVEGNIKNGVKTVVFSSSYANNWVALTTRQAMKQWENTHPGWICVAGTNADGFDINGTKQPYHYYMEDGNFLRPQGDGIILGFDDDNNFIYGNPTVTEKMYLRKYDEAHSKLVSDTVIEVVNRTPSETGINLYTKDNSYPVDLTGYEIYDCKYDLCRLGYSNLYVFVRGIVSSKITGEKDMTPKFGHFYLASKDGSLDNLITIGDYLKCEYKVTGDFEGYNQLIGCPNEIIHNGEIYHYGSTTPFINITHPRTCLGIKDNGDVVLMTVDGRGPANDYLVGASLYECGQILKKIGCTKAFNFDGGGSTTLAIRNELGEFEVVNHPSDGSERKCGNHILFVMKDPGFSLKTIDAKYNEATIDLDVTNKEAFNNISNIKLTINNETYSYNNEAIKLTNLSPLTTYPVIISYDILDPETNKTMSSRINTSFKTLDIPYPESVIKVSDVDGTSCTIDNLKADGVSNLIVNINEADYNLDNEDRIIIKDLKLNHIYYINYSYTYNYNGIIKELKGEEILIKTKSFNKPNGLLISKVNNTDNSITFNVKFNDESNVIKEAKVYVNGVATKELPHNEGINNFDITLDNISFNEDINIIVEITYLDEDKSVTFSSNLLTYNKIIIEEPIKKGCSCKKQDYLISLLSGITLLSYLLLRKK